MMPLADSNDRYVSQPLCIKCKRGVLLEVCDNSSEEEEKASEHHCNHEGCNRVNQYVCDVCNEKESYETVTNRIREAEELVEQAQSLYSERRTTEARALFEQMLIRFDDGKILPEHHHIIFNSLPPLLNCCNAQQDYQTAVKYARRIIRSMEAIMPENNRELADFYIALYDALVSLVDEKRKNDSGRRTNPLIQRFCKEAKDAAQKALRIRTLCCGENHPLTMQAHSKFSQKF